MLTHRIESEPRQFIQVLYGPRQVGKTTLALQFMESTNLPVHFASADLASTGQSGWISQQWEAARIKFRQSEKNDAVLIIDEIRKIGNWSEAVKKRVGQRYRKAEIAQGYFAGIIAAMAAAGADRITRRPV